MIRFDWTDGVVGVGIGAASYGAWLLHPAAGFICAGSLLIVCGLLAGLPPGLTRAPAATRRPVHAAPVDEGALGIDRRARAED